MKEHICKLARKGMTPSQIGVVLRDSHGVPQVRALPASASMHPQLRGASFAPNQQGQGGCAPPDGSAHVSWGYDAT